jgi:hypothetical protein
VPHGQWLHEVLGVLGATVAGALLWLRRAGWSPVRWLQERTKRPQPDGGSPTIERKLDDLDSKIESGFDAIEEKSDRNAALISHFHGEEEIPIAVDDLLDHDDDFLRGGWDDDPPDIDL